MGSSAPIEIVGPLSPDQYFSSVAPAPGLRTCRRLAIGTAGLGGAWGDVDSAESMRTLHDAWNAGFLLTDSAPTYQNAQQVVGEALKSWRSSASSPVVFTKIGGWFGDGRTHHTRASFAQQLSRSHELLGETIDGVAIHDVEEWDSGSTDEAMEILVAEKKQGRIRAIGIGGSGPRVQEQLLATGNVDYVITFKRLAAVTLQAMRDLVPMARESNVPILAASPVYMGLLSERLPSFVASPPEHIEPVFVRRAQRVGAIAREAGISLTQLAVRFLLSFPVVNFVVAGASTPNEWKDCVNAYEAGPLDQEIYEKIWRVAQEGDEPLTGG